MHVSRAPLIYTSRLLEQKKICKNWQLPTHQYTKLAIKNRRKYANLRPMNVQMLLKTYPCQRHLRIDVICTRGGGGGVLMFHYTHTASWQYQGMHLDVSDQKLWGKRYLFIGSSKFSQIFTFALEYFSYLPRQSNGLNGGSPPFKKSTVLQTLISKSNKMQEAKM